MREVYLYPYSFVEAKEREEVSLWQESFRENVACAREIEEVMRSRVSAYGLDKDCAKTILDEYGFKRVNYVLANTLKALPKERQVDPAARKKVIAPYVPRDSPYSEIFMVDGEIPLLESFIEQVHDAYQALGLFDKGHCKHDPDSENYKDKVLVLSPATLREACWSPKDQLWYAHDGFGCSPTAIGRSIRCTCLWDGEMTRWNRSDFIGILEESYLPDWAAEKLHDLLSPEQSAPAINIMEMR